MYVGKVKCMVLGSLSISFPYSLNLTTIDFQQHYCHGPYNLDSEQRQKCLPNLNVVYSG